VAAWTLIWFGTILAVNPLASLSQLGVILWSAGILLQFVLVARWFINRPASGAPVTDAKRRHAAAGA
jgi:Zn-dependent membrane protease YugP